MSSDHISPIHIKIFLYRFISPTHPQTFNFSTLLLLSCPRWISYFPIWSNFHIPHPLRSKQFLIPLRSRSKVTVGLTILLASHKLAVNPFHGLKALFSSERCRLFYTYFALERGLWALPWIAEVILGRWRSSSAFRFCTYACEHKFDSSLQEQLLFIIQVHCRWHWKKRVTVIKNTGAKIPSWFNYKFIDLLLMSMMSFQSPWGMVDLWEIGDSDGAWADWSMKKQRKF